MNKLRNLAAFIRFAWKISPRYIVLLLLNAIMEAGRLLLNVILPRYLIDALIGGTDDVLLYAGLIVLGNLLGGWIVNTMKRLLPQERRRTLHLLEMALSKKIMFVEYRHFENPYYLDLKERARFAITNQWALGNLILCFADLVRYTVVVLSLAAVMFTLSWALVLVLLATIVLMLLVQMGVSKYQVEFYQSLIPINRRYNYYVSRCFRPDGQKDFRLYGMDRMLGDRIQTSNEEITRYLSKMYKRLGLAQALHSFIGILQTALAYGYVAVRCISDVLGNRISIGGMTMYVSAAVNFGTNVFQIGANVVAVDQMLSYLEPFFELMALPDEKDVGGTEPLAGGIRSIRFEDVHFTYPNGEQPVLSGVSFEVRQGEKISIVGLNGAGKTTLIKLLCRLYKPDSGRILINGTDIFDYEADSYNRAIAAVFQDYKLLAFTVEENITSKEAGADTARAEQIVTTVGLREKIDSLKDGIKTMFGKSYDEQGTEFSGGEAQKVAIARALYKDADLVILDEPTSALDPLAEAEIYEKFNGLVGEKTALYMSHRMSSSVFCDRVLILDGGRVADFDTHANLMKKQGSLYYRMFSAQAENYRIEAEAT